MRSTTFNAYGKPVHINVHDAGDLISDRIMEGQFFENEVLEHIGMNHPVHDVIIDVGANIGNHCVFFKTYTSSNFVIGFEPEWRNFEVLQENALRYGFLAHQKGVWNRHCAWGRCTVESEGNLGMTRVELFDREDFPSDDSYAVEIVRLDDWWASNPLLQGHRLTLLKIDAEDGEPAVIDGAKKLIATHRPVLFTESRHIDHFEQLMALLTSLGYVCTACLSNRDHMFKFVHRSEA